MKHLFTNLASRPRWTALWMLLVVLLLALPAPWLLRQVDLENDVADWLPAGDEGVRVLDWYRSRFSGDDQIVVSWQGSSLDDPRVGRLAALLRGTADADGRARGGLEQIARVVTPHDLIQEMTSREVGRQEAIRRLQGVLIGRNVPTESVPTRTSAAAPPVGLLVSLSAAGRADEMSAFAAIRRAAEAAGIEWDALHMGGRAVAGTEMDAEVFKAAWSPQVPLYRFHHRSPLLLSLAVSALLAFVLLRSVRMAALVLTVTFVTTWLAFAAVPLTGGSLNMVLMVMPPLLMVLTLSAAIHVANYWKHSAHRNLRTAAVEAARIARGPCTLASLTTAVGLISLTVSPLRPVREFGMYAAFGCLLSLAMVLYVLPWLLQLWPTSRLNESEIQRTAWKGFGAFLFRRRTALSAASLAALSVGAAGLTWFQTESRVISYFPDSARIVGDYRFIEQNLTGLVPVETVIRFDREAQRRLNFLERMEIVREIGDRIRRHPQISGALSLADFRPVYEPPAAGSRFSHMVHSKRIHQLEGQVKRENGKARAFLAVADKAADLAVRGDRGLNEAGDELWSIASQAGTLADVDYGKLTRDLEGIARSTLKAHPGTGQIVTGIAPLFLRTQQAVLESLIYSFCLAFLVIGGVMMVLLRSPLAGAMTMLPNLLPVGLVFGLVSWCGVAVDIGMMITASVALGIAVDGTLHLLTWFQAGIERGMSRRAAVSHALAHAGPAMWQTSAVVGVGLLMLAPAELLLVSRFGWLMAALIGAALVADLIFLPALLAGPLGALIVESVARRQQAAERGRTITGGSVLPGSRWGVIRRTRAETPVPAE